MLRNPGSKCSSLPCEVCAAAASLRKGQVDTLLQRTVLAVVQHAGNTAHCNSCRRTLYRCLRLAPLSADLEDVIIML